MQLGQVVTAMVQAQMLGKPLTEIMGLSAPAATRASEPDYSQYDLYEPTQRAQFIKTLRDEIRSEIRAELAPHQQTIDGARRRQEYDTVAAQHGTDTNFNAKVVQALTLVKENQSLTIGQAYDLVNRIAAAVAPAAAAANPATSTVQQPAKPPATRTITAQQAEQKAEQAKTLPASNSGVRGAAPAPMPANIKNFGDMLVWNARQAGLL
jgi:ribosomal protein L12E/L44/L45/RPP1/RPP2